MKKDPTHDGWKKFLALCSNISSPEECQQIFDLFFTIEEKETLASRTLIIQALLKAKETQREIAETYKVSIAQITRGSNALKIVDPEIKKVLKNRLR